MSFTSIISPLEQAVTEGQRRQVSLAASRRWAMLMSMDVASKFIELPADIANYIFPAGLDRRLQFLLAK